METTTITCPQCGYEFELSDALTGKIRDHLRAELQHEVLRREMELKQKTKFLTEKEKEIERAKEELDERIQAGVKERLREAQEEAIRGAQESYAEQLKGLQEKLEEREKDLSEFRKREQELRQEQQRLEERQKTIDLEISRKIDEERKKIQIETRDSLKAEHLIQLKELQDALKQKEDAISEFRQKELELRKKQRELEEAKQDIELRVARQLDEERSKIQEAALKRAEDEHRLKDLEKERVINDLKASLEEMKRKAEQGPIERQGEVLEKDIEEKLRAFFPHDIIEPVAKGVSGADIIQHVRMPSMHECGILLWEIKNTKTWGGNWIQKLKEERNRIRADLAILVSVALPDTIERFGQMDGIWISEPCSAIPLAVALREQLIGVSRERISSEGKNEKMEMLYQYLCGSEFRQKIEGIVDAFTSMQEQLSKERRAMEKHWNEREKQIQRVIKNTAGLYGDMQGIIGGQIPKIEALELDNGTVRQLPYSFAEVSSEG